MIVFFFSSIASRIYGLAVALVCIMIALVGFLLWQVSVTSRELRTISNIYEPLERTIIDLNESGLKRKIAFEQWHYSRIYDSVHTKIATDSQQKYAKYTQQIDQDIKKAVAILEVTHQTNAENIELQKIKTLLDQFIQNFGIITKRHQEIFTLPEEGNRERASDILSVIEDMQNVVQDQRDEMQQVIVTLVEEATNDATSRHQQILWTTVAATAVSALLGLTLAALITRRLVKPLRSLMIGIETVEKGDLNVDLAVQSRDEIGALTNSFNYFVSELRVKEEIRSAFGKYVDPRILDSVILHPSVNDVTGARREMSVTFADLVGFTSIAEHLTPAGLVKLLNHHFTLQADAVQQHHGVVDKFIGDAIMAFWGPPFTAPDEHAAKACQAALAQVAAITKLQEMLPEITGLRKNLPQISLRLGISTGEVIVGNIGSENTHSYTVIGDTVNLASRLEQANRFYQTSILICDNTRSLAGDVIVSREIDCIVVKGKTESTHIYELIGIRGKTLESEINLAECFSSALAAYRVQDWDCAEAGFHACLKVRANDKPSEIFLDRIRNFRINPPSTDWNGTWVFDEK